VSDHQAHHDVSTQCRVLDVSRSGYYAWQRRPLSARAREDIELTQRIRRIHATSRGTYGAPRMHAALAAEGVRVGRKRVARLMVAAGLEGVSRRRGVRTTVRDERDEPAADLVDRDFAAPGPDLLWVADLTYIHTRAGFLFLAVVLDAWSRKVIGWSVSTTLHTRVVLDALDAAAAQRRPRDVVHHSDKGSQYTSTAFGGRCRELGVKPSTGSVGDAYDNAMAESFFASLECELLHRRAFESKAQARVAVFEWIEGWYNPHRLHSALGYRSPIDFERAHAENAARELVDAV
jgi:putative transposase